MTAPLELTWNCEVEPTENKDEGLVVPIPTFPLLSNRVIPFVQAFAPDLYCKFKAPVAGLMIPLAPPRVRVAEVEALPVGAPMFKVVAAPAKLTVVAVVLRRSKEVDPVVKDVVITGEVKVLVPAKV